MIQNWEQIAKKVLLGKKIVMVRYMTDQELFETGYNKRGLIFELEDGTIVWTSSDNEGNDAGALFFEATENSSLSDFYVLPVL